MTPLCGLCLFAISGICSFTGAFRLVGDRRPSAAGVQQAEDTHLFIRHIVDQQIVAMDHQLSRAWPSAGKIDLVPP